MHTALVAKPYVDKHSAFPIRIDCMGIKAISVWI